VGSGWSRKLWIKALGMQTGGRIDEGWSFVGGTA
jgi:hypothetical protein